MAWTRLSFIWNFGNSGWSEQWYRNSTTLEAASTFTGAQLSQFAQLRGIGCELEAIRANLADNPRVSLLTPIEFIVGLQPVNQPFDAEPPGVAILLYGRFVGNRHRSIMVKGLSDDAVQRGFNGKPIWNPKINAGIAAYVNFIKTTGLAMRYLLPDTIPNPNRRITQLIPLNNGLTTGVQYDATTPIPAKSKVIIHGLSRQEWPGFQGVLPSIPNDAGTLELPIRYPANNQIAPGLLSTIRVALFDYAQMEGATSRDIRVHKVGRPTLLSRGRRPGLRFRAR